MTIEVFHPYEFHQTTQYEILLKINELIDEVNYLANKIRQLEESSHFHADYN